MVDAFLGGWTISGISTMASGEPVTLQYTPSAAFQVSGITQIFRGANNYRPNVNGDPYGDKNSVTNYLSLTNVTVPTDPSQPFGNAKRNNVSGPGYWNVDFVASKEFAIPLGDQTRLQFRFEAFNLFNRTNSPRAERQPQQRELRHDHPGVGRAADAAGGEADVLTRTGSASAIGWSLVGHGGWRPAALGWSSLLSRQ